MSDTYDPSTDATTRAQSTIHRNGHLNVCATCKPSADASNSVVTPLDCNMHDVIAAKTHVLHSIMSGPPSNGALLHSTKLYEILDKYVPAELPLSIPSVTELDFNVFDPKSLKAHYLSECNGVDLKASGAGHRDGKAPKHSSTDLRRTTNSATTELKPLPECAARAGPLC